VFVMCDLRSYFNRVELETGGSRAKGIPNGGSAIEDSTTFALEDRAW
jgi:hypothetical protein